MTIKHATSALPVLLHRKYTWQYPEFDDREVRQPMGNKHAAKALELSWQEGKAREAQKLVDPRTDDKVATH